MSTRLGLPALWVRFGIPHRRVGVGFKGTELAVFHLWVPDPRGASEAAFLWRRAGSICASQVLLFITGKCHTPCCFGLLGLSMLRAHCRHSGQVIFCRCYRWFPWPAHHSLADSVSKSLFRITANPRNIPIRTEKSLDTIIPGSL